MIDLKELRQNPAAVKERLRVKGFELDIDRFGELESQRKVLQEETEG
ncbi:MAG: serine--tRNA ligase, partial [Pseudomonadales bacterium]